MYRLTEVCTFRGDNNALLIIIATGEDGLLTGWRFTVIGVCRFLGQNNGETREEAQVSWETKIPFFLKEKRVTLEALECLLQVRLRTEVLHTPCSTRARFELMTSRL